MTEKYFPYKQEGELICKAYYDIKGVYGTSLKEKAYHKLLQEYFTKKSIPFAYEPTLQVKSLETNKVIDIYRPDFSAFNKILIEVKVSAFTPRQAQDQLLHYLKNSEYEIGYLLNFGVAKSYIKRYIFTNDRKQKSVASVNS